MFVATWSEFGPDAQGCFDPHNPAPICWYQHDVVRKGRSGQATIADCLHQPL